MNSNTNFKAEYSKEFQKHMSAVNKWFKRIYVWAFNIYAWFWLYRQIFVRHSGEWEDYLLWFFTTAGMYYFVLDTKDTIFFENRVLKNKEEK